MIATFNRDTQLLQFKGGLLDGDPLAPEQVQAIARLPARDVLYGQLVGIVASPVSGLVRTLNALIGGLALQLGQIAEQRQSGEPAAPQAEPQPAGDQDAEAPEPPSATDAPAEGADTPSETDNA